VIEAATLSGRTPAEIRTLIQAGRLAAEPVALPGGTGYLIEPRALAALGVDLAVTPDAGRPGPLRAALAGLRAALARRQGGRPRAEAADPEPPGPAREAPRAVVGLQPAELAALAGRVERLLGR
jgi:hypothetical protein